MDEQQMIHAVKALGETDTHYLVGGYGVVWGGKDLTGDTFTKDTDLWLDKLSPTPPLMYHHGLDATIKRVVLGNVVTTKADDTGLWVESQIVKAQQYAKGVIALVNKGMLGYSIGSAKHLVEKMGGILKAWPMVELSLSPTPCEPRTLGVRALRSIAEYEPAVKAYLPQGDGESPADATKADDDVDTSNTTGAADMSDKDVATEAPVVETPVPAVKAAEIDMGAIADMVVKKLYELPNLNFGATKAGPPPVPDATDLDHIKAFNEVLRFGKSASADALKVTYQVGSETGGGYLQPPTQWVDQLIQKVDDAVFIRGLARKFRVPNADSLGAPSLDTDAEDSDWTSELAVGNEENTMAVGKRELRPNPLAKYIKVSNTLLRKVASSESLVMERLAYKIGVTQEKAFLTGTGAGQPLGVFTASALGINTTADVTGGTATDIDADDILNTKYTLKPQYWPRAQWIMHRDVVKLCAKMKDGESRPLWDNGGINAGLGTRPTLAGFPVNMSEFAPNTLTASQYVAILGDFSFYWIADALDMQIQRVVELYAATNQTGFFFRAEMDALPVLEEPFVRLKLGS